MAFENLKSRYRRIKRNMTRGLAWDIFMVYLAVINLGLILFDMTYLWLRPTYFRYLPVVTRIYDPVKGIEPHPLTEAWLVASTDLANRLEAGEEPYRLASELEEIRYLAREVLINKAFERSGQDQSGRRIWVGMARFLRSEPGNSPIDQAQPARISDLFWFKDRDV